MSNHHLIVDALTLANRQLERLRILTLVLSNSDELDMLPKSQQNELDHWMFDMVDQAQTHIETAMAYSQQKDGAPVFDEVQS